MVVCPNCKNEQESGKFCGICGTGLVESNSIKEEQPKEVVKSQSVTAATNEQTQTSNQEGVETAKKAIGDYWSYFIQLLKNPTNSFNATENHFVYGIITMVLYAMAFSLGIYFLANSFARDSIFMDSLPFFTLNIRLILVVSIVLAITFFSAFAITKLAKSTSSIKVIVSQYGGLLVPFTTLNIVGMLGGLIGSNILTLIPLLISSVMAFTFIPVLYVYEKASQVSKSGQRVYLSLATTILIAIIYVIFGEIMFNEMLEELEYIF
ncbi:hypothetical protein [Oceanobacillus sp. 1P07AA]|uniref:hypothetical protein n=1 Tax=Oceanobacillus sp. 1P07AA TaxID=3132293 RepID=UPI0039A60D58